MEDAVQEQPAKQSMGLEEALEVLNRPQGSTQEDPQQLQSRLLAIQAACTRVVQLVSAGGRLPTDLLENALEAVARGLSAARRHLELTAGQLAAVRAAAWSEALLAAADTCMHSEAWHEAWHTDASGGGREAYGRTVGLARDMLKNDLLPLLCGAAAQQTAATGFCLATQFRALLDMGHTAAEIVGLRDPRHRRPSLRNYSVLNALWNGLQKLWCAVAPEARADMERQGLGAAAVAGALLGYARKDLRACHRLLDPAVGKLLQYWLQKAKFVLGSYPAAGTACWPALLEVALCAHQELALLAAAAAANPSAAQLVDAVRAHVLPKAVALLVACLSGTTADDQLRVMLDELRMRLSGSDQPGQAVHALHTTLHLLHSTPSMPPLARHHCAALLGGVLDALPGAACTTALHSGELREQVADAVLVFLASCCHAAATAPGDEALQAWERQLAAQTWERCQQLLLLHAMQPHPLTEHVLGSAWADLAGCASEPLLKAHISLLRDLLRLAAAAEASGGHAPPSPLYLQLLGLLARLLAAAPPAIAAAYFANFLQVLPSTREDACQLACLSAELRLAALVEASAGSTAAALQVQAVLNTLFTRLIEVGALVARRAAAGSGKVGPGAGPGEEAEPQAAYLAWLLDAIQCGVAYLVRTGAAQEEGPCAALLPTLASRLAYLLAKTAGRGAFACYAAPTLGALRELLPVAPLAPPELQALLPALAACQQVPQLAAAVAEVAPALARCPVPHAEVLHAALSAPGVLLQHLGLEAFRRYAQACPVDGNILAALPPSMRNPETGAMLGSAAAMLQQYTQRCPAGGASPGEQEAAEWAAALRQEALGAAAALRRAVEACRAQAASDSAAQASPPGSEPAAQGSDDSGGASAAAAAVEQLASSLQQAEAALQAGPLDAAAAQLLRQCSARLAQLVTAAGMAEG